METTGKDFEVDTLFSNLIIRQAVLQTTARLTFQKCKSARVTMQKPCDFLHPASLTGLSLTHLAILLRTSQGL